jgi:hypothetical protein
VYQRLRGQKIIELSNVSDRSIASHRPFATTDQILLHHASLTLIKNTARCVGMVAMLVEYGPSPVTRSIPSPQKAEIVGSGRRDSRNRHDPPAANVLADAEARDMKGGPHTKAAYIATITTATTTSRRPASAPSLLSSAASRIWRLQVAAADDFSSQT